MNRLAALLFSMMITSPCVASGSWDGIYFCNLAVAGQKAQQYITINGQPDGRAIFVAAAVSQYTEFYGYGIGQVVGNVFSGNTMFAQPFRMVATSSGFSGSIGVVIEETPFSGTAICSKIW